MKQNPFELALVSKIKTLRQKGYEVAYKITDTGYGLVSIKVKSPTQAKLDKIGADLKALEATPECHINFVTYDGHMQALFSSDEIDNKIKAQRIALAQELGYSESDIERIMAQEKSDDVLVKLLALELIFSGKRSILSIKEEEFDSAMVPLLYEGYSRCIGRAPGADDFDIMANAGLIIKQWVCGVRVAAATQH